LDQGELADAPIGLRSSMPTFLATHKSTSNCRRASGGGSGPGSELYAHERLVAVAASVLARFFRPRLLLHEQSIVSKAKFKVELNEHQTTWVASS